MGKIKFTAASIQTLPTPKSGRALYRDADQEYRGLGILIQSSGYRVFFWSRKIKGHGLGWQTLGRVEDVSLAQAREKAREYNGMLGKWKLDGAIGPNPFKAEKSAEMTLADLVEKYIDGQVRKNANNFEKAAATVRWTINKYIPSWKQRRLAQISKHDVETLHRVIGEAPDERKPQKKTRHYAANRIVVLLKILFNFATAKGWYSGANPAIIERYKEEQRVRHLSDAEYVRLAAALQEEKNRSFADFIWLSLKIGARKSDMLEMKWDAVDLPNKKWLCPNSKSAKPYEAHLDVDAVAILEARHKSRTDSPFVFAAPGGAASGHVSDYSRYWRALLKRSQITNFRLHDLRHSFISSLVQGGVSLSIAGKAVGHGSVASTQRYAHLSIDDVRGPIDAMVARKQALLDASKKPAKAKVLPMRQRKAG